MTHEALCPVPSKTHAALVTICVCSCAPSLARAALLFHSMKPGGELEERSMHGACPVIKGEKFSMTK